MIEINYDDYRYFPTLRTRQAELKGLEQLDVDRKRQIVPLLTLGRWPRALDFTKAADKARDCMAGLPYFLDLTTDARHLIEHQSTLRDPANGFAAWRTFVNGYPLAIPVVQTTGGAAAQSVRDQVLAFEGQVGRVAFRIRDFSFDTPMVLAALSEMHDPYKAIVFIDCQYIRNALSAYIAASVATIDSLRAAFPGLVIVVLSTSFPLSTISFSDPATQRSGFIDIQERNLHSSIGGDSVAIYGDHASIHSVVYDDTTIMTWAARIDFPRELDWHFERRPRVQSEAGYIDCAQSLVASEPDIGTRNIWGEQMIVDAAAGRPHAKAPASWISVRVNIHLSRQIDFSTAIFNAEDEDPDFSA